MKNIDELMSEAARLVESSKQRLHDSDYNKCILEVHASAERSLRAVGLLRGKLKANSLRDYALNTTYYRVGEIEGVSDEELVRIQAGYNLRHPKHALHRDITKQEAELYSKWADNIYLDCLVTIERESVIQA